MWLPLLCTDAHFKTLQSLQKPLDAYISRASPEWHLPRLTLPSPAA